MRFLIDMPLSRRYTRSLRHGCGKTVMKRTMLPLLYCTAPGTAIIAVARHQNRIIITADLDFSQLLAISHAKDPGIIVFPGGNYNEQGMRQLLKRVLELYPENKFLHTITVVDKVRIRHCPLLI